ncbi:unnamed protein product [Victoria cruziana]
MKGDQKHIRATQIWMPP